MTTQVIVLNGGSSSGKSTIARCLQAVLPDPWLAFSVDVLVDAMPPTLKESPAGLDTAPDGTTRVGEDFQTLDRAWAAGIAAMAHAGARVIVDDVFLAGPQSQQRWQEALTNLNVLWVGVHCDSKVAAAREQARGDRPKGMAESQAEQVHKNVTYNLEVNTTNTDAQTCAQAIATQTHEGLLGPGASGTRGGRGGVHKPGGEHRPK